MAILWAGQSDIDYLGAVGCSLNTNGSSTYRTGYVRNAITVGSATSYLRTPEVADQSEIWFTTRIGGWYFYGGYALLSFRRGNSEIFQIRTGASISNQLAVYRNPNVLAAMVSNVPSSVPTKLDVHYLKSGSGYVRLYIDGALTPAIDYNGDTSTWGDVDQVDMLYAGYYCAFSESIMATEDTRLFSLRELYPSAAGASNAWTGAYSDIDDSTTDTTDVISSATANQEASFALPDLPAGNFSVKQVRFSALASRGTTGPTQLQLGVRVGGTNYYGSAHALDTAWDIKRTNWDVRPSDSQEWAASDINALEMAFKSGT